MTTAKTMELTEQQLLQYMRQSVPPLCHNRHKGEAGRIGVFGGSLEYTGAPYFSAISSLRAGSDLAHIFCSKEASTVIKSYSPELIVHPLLDAVNAVEEISLWLPRLHAVVLGPGLGRDSSVFKILPQMIKLIKERNIPLVIDADGLFYVNNNFQDLQGCSNVVLTPNAAEFARLYEAVSGRALDPSMASDAQEVDNLSQMLGHVTILCKGKRDVISNGHQTVVCRETLGSARRCGGQGDLLSGILATFLHWTQSDATAQFPTLSAACAASTLTKTMNCRAFQVHRRAMLASDMIPFLGPCFLELLEREE